MANAVVEELARSGVTHACISPGSRSSAPALALARAADMKTFVVTDERSAAYFALGMARELGRPVVLLCTSGTAAANYLPGIVEASLSEVPLVVLTADRPAELRDCRAAQTIDQVGLYGRSVRFAADLEAPAESPDLEAFQRRLTCRAVAAALGRRKGPVHLNLPMREPLFDLGGMVPGGAALAPTTRVLQGRSVLDERDAADLAEALHAHPRGLVVSGPEPHAHPQTVATLARRLGWPILADPVSALRFGPHERSGVVTAYDVLLRDPGFFEAHVPDAILQLGPLPASRSVQRLVSAAPAKTHVVIASEATWPDPLHHATTIVHADGDRTLEDLSKALPEPTSPSPWASSWQRASERVRHRLEATVRDEAGALEGKLFPILLDSLPEGALVYLGNSMPVRDADTFLGSSARRVGFAANRGASGIDGVVSSALGAAAVRRAPTILVVGDLSFLHDLSALQIAARHRLSLLVVVVQNDGGGIFSFLPQAGLAEFESLFGTPHGLDLEPAVRMCGGRYHRPSGWDEVARTLAEESAAEGLRVVEIRSARDENRRLHGRALERALAALGEAVP